MALNTDKLFRTTAVIALALGLTTLTACGGTDTPAPSTPAAEQSTPAAETETETADVDDTAVEADLTAAFDAVTQAVADYPDAQQIVLSTSATEPSFAYGALELPFTPSDATSKLTQAVAVKGGEFVISATSAASGIVYTIDQTGAITQ